MIPKGSPAFFFGIFLLISGNYIYGLKSSSVIHSHHDDIVKDWVSHLHAKHYPVLATKVHDDTRDKVKTALARAVVEEKVKAKWEDLKTATPPVFTESAGPPKRVVFDAASGGITLKEVFHYQQFFPLLYSETDPVLFEIPVDGKTITLKLKNQVDPITGKKTGKFDIYNVYPDPTTPGTPIETNLKSDIGDVVKELTNTPTETNLHEALEKTLENKLPEMFNAKLDAAPVFEDELKIQDTRKEVTDAMKEKAFREAVEVMASTSILRTDLTKLSPPTWLENVDQNHFKIGREGLEANLENEIRDDGQTKLMFELTASMLQTSTEVSTEWNKLRTTDTFPGSGQKVLVETMSAANPLKAEEVTIRQTNEFTLKQVFKMLQSYNDLYPHNLQRERVRFIIPIGGEDRTVHLSRAPRGKNQIFVETQNRQWPDATKQKEIGGYYGPPYEIMINKVLKKFPNHQKLAETIINACDSKLNAQPDFLVDLQVTNADGSPNVLETADTIRNTVELMVITMVAEAAQPSDEVKTKFLEHIAKTIRVKERFPTRDEMPKLHYGLKEKGNTNLSSNRNFWPGGTTRRCPDS